MIRDALMNFLDKLAEKRKSGIPAKPKANAKELAAEQLQLLEHRKAETEAKLKAAKAAQAKAETEAADRAKEETPPAHLGSVEASVYSLLLARQRRVKQKARPSSVNTG